MAGVVGGIFAVLLIAFIIALVIWYQICRRDDPKDETNRESAFDFSKKRTQATNPTNSDIVLSQESLAKSTVSQAPPVAPEVNKTDEKTDLTVL